MTPFVGVLALGLAGQAESSFCRNPPSRASDAYCPSPSPRPSPRPSPSASPKASPAP